eukprot:jgi/Tetstr1/446682/TSEL_003621.t1
MDNVSLRNNVDMINKREKLDKNVESLQVQLEAERMRSQAKDAAVKDIRAAAVHAEIAHGEKLAKAVSRRDFGEEAVRRAKRESTNGGEVSNRAGAKAWAAIKDRKMLRAFGMRHRPTKKRIKAPLVLNGSEFRGFKRREVAKLKTYLDSRYEGVGVGRS